MKAHIRIMNAERTNYEELEVVTFDQFNGIAFDKVAGNPTAKVIHGLRVDRVYLHARDTDAIVLYCSITQE